MRQSALATAAIAAALTGCGGSGDEADVKAAVNGYLHAFVRGNGARTCSLMTERTQAEFVRGARPLAHTSDCAKATIAVRAAAGRRAIDALRDAKVSDVEIDGNQASAKITASTGQSVATVSKQDGKWLVSSAVGSP